jgi:hypothetical protein
LKKIWYRVAEAMKKIFLELFSLVKLFKKIEARLKEAVGKAT